MTREASEYCKECKYCEAIICDRFWNIYMIQCNEGWGNIRTQSDAVIYCKRKKLKKEKKRKC